MRHPYQYTRAVVGGVSTAILSAANRQSRIGFARIGGSCKICGMFKTLAVAALSLALLACGDAIHIQQDSSYEVTADWRIVGVAAGVIVAIVLAFLILRLAKWFGEYQVSVNVGTKSDADVTVDVAESQSGVEAEGEAVDVKGVDADTEKPSIIARVRAEINVQRIVGYIAVGVIIGLWASSRCGVGI